MHIWLKCIPLQYPNIFAVNHSRLWLLYVLRIRVFNSLEFISCETHAVSLSRLFAFYIGHVRVFLEHTNNRGLHLFGVHWLSPKHSVAQNSISFKQFLVPAADGHSTWPVMVLHHLQTLDEIVFEPWLDSSFHRYIDHLSISRLMLKSAE